MHSQNAKIEYTYQDKDNYKCKSYLYIYKNKESVFRINDDREGGIKLNEKTDNVETIYNDKISKVFYSTDKMSITRIPIYKNEIIYSDLNSKIKYNLTGLSKKINNFNCQQAKFSLNGRKYSVWFTPDVEINFGPLKLNGLPGLLIEVYEETNKVKLTFNSMNKLTNLDEFNKFKNYLTTKKELPYNEYEKKMINIMTTKKRSMISKLKEYNATVNFSSDHSSFTEFLIDIPINLVSELQKIKE